MFYCDELKVYSIQCVNVNFLLHIKHYFQDIMFTRHMLWHVGMWCSCTQ